MAGDMKIINNTPFKHFIFKHWFDEEELGVLIVQGLFFFDETGRAGYAAEQGDFVMADQFHGEPNQSSVLYESNLVPLKPKTDVIINAVARSSDKKPLTQWNVGVAIDKQLSYEFMVRGKSEWRANKIGKKWKLSDPEPMTELPIRYEYAYGGISQDEQNEDEIVYAYNPVGVGFYHEKVLAQKKPLAAPQIGDMAEFMQEDIGLEMQVRGFGSLAKSWLPRRSLAGTFNDKWQNQTAPKMPEDYKMSYWNGAPVTMQVYPYLLGNESLVLKGLRHDPSPWKIPLAMGGVSVTFHYEEIKPESSILYLDTVYLDIASDDIKDHKLIQTWRLVFGAGDYTLTQIEINSDAIKKSKTKTERDKNV